MLNCHSIVSQNYTYLLKYSNDKRDISFQRMAEYLMEEVEMSSVSSHDKGNEDGYNEFEIGKSTVI